MSKGHWRRPENYGKTTENLERIFGPRPFANGAMPEDSDESRGPEDSDESGTASGPDRYLGEPS